MERLGVGRRGDDHCYLHALSPQNLSHIPQRDLNLFFLRNAINTVSNCRGLLCFNSSEYGGRTVICNPTTQQLKFLPPTPRLHASLGKGVYAFGFGYDSASDDYKVIRHYTLYNYRFSGNDEHGEKYFAGASPKIELYSLRHHSWREIPVPFRVLLIDFYHGSPYVNGSAYWVAKYCGDQLSPCILAFDFATENFSWFSLPPHPPGTCSSLFKIDDESLGVVLYSNGVGKFFELWMWRRGLWTQLYDRVFLDNVAEPLELIDGRLLFLERDISCDVQQLVVYDWVTKELKELDIYEHTHRNMNRMMIISYVESRFELPNAMPIAYYDNEESWDEYWLRYKAEVNEVDRP